MVNTSDQVLAYLQACVCGCQASRFDTLLPLQVTVILSHMFSPDELAAEPHLAHELEADITSECVRLGPITKVCLVIVVIEIAGSTVA